MPICEADPWRMQYFEHVACPADVLISTEDADCLGLVSALALGLRQGRGRAVARGSRPRRTASSRRAFPVFSKPITNLKGMGVGSRVLRSTPPTTSTHYAPGHMWMTLLDRPPRLLRRRGARRAAGVVAPRDRRAGRGGHVRLLDGARRARHARSSSAAARGSRSISPAIPACSISKPSAGASSRCICASPTSGPTSTARAGSRRWCGSIEHQRWDYPDD